MPLFAKGCYAKCNEDYPYEVETTYQLKYYISSALISIDCILKPDETMIGRFESKVHYYRYYVDNIFNFLGLINDRFVCKNSRDVDLTQKKKERIELNKNNYYFSEVEFSILVNKTPRNIIEHLDERNVKTMMVSRGVGGFNVIFEDSDPNMVAAINSNREFYPYNLDLVNKKILFYNIQAGPDDIKEFEIDMLKMQDELKKLAAFIMFTFIFMFIITDEMIEAVIPILIGLGLVPALSVVVTIVFVVFLKLWRTSPIKKLNYKKVVLFHSIYDDPDYLVSVKYLYVYEKINNRIELVSYPVGFNNFTMKDVYYGQMLYKCSIDAENESTNMHYFYYLL